MQTKVIFRQWRDKQAAPLALFPEHCATLNPTFCESWAPGEGHGSAWPEVCMRRTRPATPEQVADMTSTLTRGYGYDLEIIERLPRGHYHTRLKALTSKQAKASSPTVYTIYVGRRIVATLRTTLTEATKTWNVIADTYTGRFTVALYEGKRAVENLCARQTTH